MIVPCYLFVLEYLTYTQLIPDLDQLKCRFFINFK